MASAVGLMAIAGVAIGSSAARAPARPTPPRHLTAGRMHRRPGAVARGTRVRSSQLFGDRVFFDAREGFALATDSEAQYPALTLDGGRHWRIDGPQFHVDAADGPEGVGFVGVTGPRTLFAYGSSVVDVTTDRGRTWWETHLGEQVTAVVPGIGGGLVAFVQQSVSDAHLNPAMTWEYVSRDGGRHWSYSTPLGGMVTGQRAATFPDAPRGQPGNWRLHGICRPAAPNPYLPRRAGCVTVQRADVDGDGHPDVIVLYARLTDRRHDGGYFPASFTLMVLSTRAGVLSLRVPHPLEPPWILRVRNVNDRPGAEIFIHETHLSSGELAGVYTFAGGGLRREGGFWYGGDSAVREGFICRAGPAATVVQHLFLLQRGGEDGWWRRTDTTYRWAGAALRRGAKQVTQRHGFPPRRLTTASC